MRRKQDHFRHNPAPQATSLYSFQQSY